MSGGLTVADLSLLAAFGAVGLLVVTTIMSGAGGTIRRTSARHLARSEPDVFGLVLHRCGVSDRQMTHAAILFAPSGPIKLTGVSINV